MPYDFKYIRLCGHEIFDEVLTIDGSSPSYIGYTKHPSTQNKKTTFIREYNVVENQATIIQSRDGITNYTFDGLDNTKINFTFNPATNSVDYRDDLVPTKIYLIDYVAPLASCPVCLGEGTIKDITFDGGGRLVAVTGKEKLKQTVLKAIATTLGNNLYDDQYGGGVYELVGEKIDNFTAIRLQQRIQDAVSHLVEIQAGVDLTADEQILRINDISVSQDLQEPTTLNVQIIITNGQWQDVSVNLQLGLI